MASAGFECDAFISYNHMEKLLAERLSRRIRRYRPPRSLGPELAKRRLVVFRDTERLTTKGELTDALLEHDQCCAQSVGALFARCSCLQIRQRRNRKLCIAAAATHAHRAGRRRSLECIPARAESAIQGATLHRSSAAERMVALAPALSRRVAAFDRGLLEVDYATLFREDERRNDVNVG